MVKLEPIDLIQKTNIRQHDLMISAINDNKEEIDEVRAVEDIAVSDISTIKNNIVVLSNEKLDKEYIDKDLHIGNISVTLEGTQAVATLDVYNPVTGITTPISFNLPGATPSTAGVMTSSDVSWMQTAEERLAMLEGMSDVNAVTDLPSDPTQEQLSYGWTSGTGKSPETGDILQDVSNAKLWVFVTDTWMLYGTLVVVPMATTTSIGGIKDTALDAVGNRWYCHVEADGRVALIGGDVLSTLVDTTVPALQSGVDNSVKKTGDTMSGRLYANGNISIERGTDGGVTFKRTDISYDTPWNRYKWDRVLDKDNKTIGEYRVTCSNNDPTFGRITNAVLSATNYTDDDIAVNSQITAIALGSGEAFATATMRASPGVIDIVNKGYLDTRLTAKQDTLIFDSTPVLNSTKPVTSGGVYNSLVVKADKSELTAGLALKADVPTWTYGSGMLTTNAGTCGYNYAYYVIGNVVTMRFTVGTSVDSVFTVPLPVSVGSATIQMSGISDDARFWSDYNGTSASSVIVHRAQTTVSSKSFHVLVIGHKSS